MDAEGAKARGCLFCRSGKEREVAREFERAFPGGAAMVPTRTRYRRTAETATEEKVPLLPGYVFFELSDDNSAEERVERALRSFTRKDGVLRLLRYSDGKWRLHGYDDQFARMLFAAGGNIGISQAYFDVGKRIRILSGFLKDYEGSITRVIKKTRTVEVSIDLQGKKVTMRLGYELVEPAEP